MSDIQMLKDQLEGLIAQGKKLREKEAFFLKLQGINEELEKANQEKAELAEKLAEAKEKRDSLKAQKKDAVSKTAEKIIEKLDSTLPAGNAVFEISEENGLFIGWNVDKTVKPYNGLSGGEKQIFDTALANVLDADLIIVEAAELDDANLIATLHELGKLENKQVLVNTCHMPKDSIPEPFVQITI